MAIGDINSDEMGTGARYNDDKPDLSLIPLSTLEDEARVWMHGEKKYKKYNWMKGMPWSVPLACALRHLAAWQAGEDIDPESGLPHLAHVMCNIRMLTLYADNYLEGDDRPTKYIKKIDKKSQNKITNTDKKNKDEITNIEQLIKKHSMGG